jgi:hypothetical protein
MADRKWNEGSNQGTEGIGRTTERITGNRQELGESAAA